MIKIADGFRATSQVGWARLCAHAWTQGVFLTLLMAVTLFCGCPAARAAAAPSYDKIITEAQAQLGQGKLEDAFLTAAAAINADKKRWEGYAVAALVMSAKGNDAQALVYVDKALPLAPADKQATLKEMRQKFSAPAPAPKTAEKPAIAQDTTALPPEARRQLDVLIVIARDADRATKQVERERYLTEYLEKSTPFLEQNPDQLEVWLVRAMAAMELKRSEEGWAAGKRLKELGVGEGEDQKLRMVMAGLERLGWLGEVSPGEMERQRLEREKKELLSKNYIEPLTSMEFVVVPGGCFQMGDLIDDGRANEKPVHEVCVDGFQIGKYEVTQGQWTMLMGVDYPKVSIGGYNYPIENVSWNDTQAFISKLNQQTGRNFRLPTEAEWEYAARSGGKKERYAGGDNAEVVANYGIFGSIKPVGSKAANGLGIYDMSGNVDEWCQDWYDEKYYGISPRNNPTGPSAGTHRLVRGGCWMAKTGGGLRTSYRSGEKPSSHFNQGFRLVLPTSY